MVNSTVQNYQDISRELDGEMLSSTVNDKLELARQEAVSTASTSKPVAMLIVHTPNKTWDILF